MKRARPSRRAIEDAARRALRERGGVARSPSRTADPLYDEVANGLNDPALSEALAACAARRPANGRALVYRSTAMRVGATALAACFTIVAWVGLWSAYRPESAPFQHFETQPGRLLAVQLADGSRLQLNGLTSLDVRIGRRERRVRLTQGEAFFDVAHQPNRPFVVTAGGAEARVLGTAFDLDRTQAQVRLAVYRGRVRFGDASGQGSDLVVVAGRRASFNDGVVRPATAFNAAQQDWREGWLDTDGVTLAEVVEELNRRAGPQVAAPPAALAGIRLAGRFRLDGADRLLPALGAAYGFRVEREGGGRLRLSPA